MLVQKFSLELGWKEQNILLPRKRVLFNCHGVSSYGVWVSFADNVLPGSAWFPWQAMSRVLPVGSAAQGPCHSTASKWAAQSPT